MSSSGQIIGEMPRMPTLSLYTTDTAIFAIRTTLAWQSLTPSFFMLPNFSVLRFR